MSVAAVSQKVLTFHTVGLV